MTRAKSVLMFPPSPMIAWVKLPELRTYVESPSPNVVRSIVTPAQAVGMTFCWLYGRPRRVSMRRVSRPMLESVLSPASAQKKGPERDVVALVVTNFSIRIVALPLDGDVVLP